MINIIIVNLRPSIELIFMWNILMCITEKGSSYTPVHLFYSIVIEIGSITQHDKI